MKCSFCSNWQFPITIQWTSELQCFAADTVLLQAWELWLRHGTIHCNYNLQVQRLTSLNNWKPCTIQHPAGKIKHPWPLKTRCKTLHDLLMWFKFSVYEDKYIYVPGQESLPTSPSGHTAKVSARRDAMWMRQHSSKGVFISTDSAWQWVNAAPLSPREVRLSQRKRPTAMETVKYRRQGRWRRRRQGGVGGWGSILTWRYSHRWGRPGQQWKQEGKR